MRCTTGSYIALRTLSRSQAENALTKAAHVRNGNGQRSARNTTPPLTNPPDPGAMFLKSNLVTPVFQALGIPEPAAKYERLITMVMTTLRAPVQVSP
jgi:hypothetical protein